MAVSAMSGGYFSDSFKHLALLFLVICMPAFLGGCTAAALSSLPFNESEINLTQSSYAAADMLVQQASGHIAADTPLQIGVLTDMNNPAVQSSFGKVIAGQIGARFVQLGYNVRAIPFEDMMMALQKSQSGSAPGPAKNNYDPQTGTLESDAMITGQYAIAKSKILMNLRIMEAKSGRVLAAYDYELPYNSDMKALTRTEAKKESLFGF